MKKLLPPEPFGIPPETSRCALFIKKTKALGVSYKAPDGSMLRDVFEAHYVGGWAQWKADSATTQDDLTQLDALFRTQGTTLRAALSRLTLGGVVLGVKPNKKLRDDAGRVLRGIKRRGGES